MEERESVTSVGVVFPAVDGRRSTSATGRAVVSAALDSVDPVAAASAGRQVNWRSGYVGHFRRLVEAGIGSPENARRIAGQGLAAVAGQLRWMDASGVEGPLESAAAVSRTGAPLVTEQVRGGAEPETELRVPYRGGSLTGDDLRRHLDHWVRVGVVEPGVRDAVAAVQRNPHWLALPAHTMVVLGAGAQMGPMRALLRWGATVAALDLPAASLWTRVLGDGHALAGSLLFPTRAGLGDPVERRAGVNMVTDLPAALEWVRGLGGCGPGGDRSRDRLVLGNYVYAAGADNVRVSAAVDVLAEAVRTERPDTALAFLATPTDVFAVPGSVVEASVAAYARRPVHRRALGLSLRAASGGRLLRANYLPGSDPGIVDCVVPQQGPNYLLAKRIQRWRATVAAAQGTTVSLRVAPPTRTRSVVRNRALAAAYAGAHRFGIEVFEPGTANTLMAALLVHDLFGDSPGHPEPWQDEAWAAAHGGLWRCAFHPRSALGLAALLGVVAGR